MKAYFNYSRTSNYLSNGNTGYSAKLLNIKVIDMHLIDKKYTHLRPIQLTFTNLGNHDYPELSVYIITDISAVYDVHYNSHSKHVVEKNDNKYSRY